ncbi:MAG: cysteine desulfurase [Verrucomicrobiales bacterium]|nr:cysteine desulfurase [Verrucomicrobiales bacterium]
MEPFLNANFGNPSSVHHMGRLARAALDAARERVARVFGCKPSEIVFTSGGTESVNLALFGSARSRRPLGRHIVTSSIEHHAVLNACQYLERSENFEVTYLPVNAQGMVEVHSVEKAIRSDTILVSIMAANNETGAIQPVAEIGALCRSRGIPFHTDAVQWFGKKPFASIAQFNADFVSLCAHKIHGPKGAGALFVKSPFRVNPILFGGAHENEQRAGTENVASIVGMAEAVERFVHNAVFEAVTLTSLTAQIEKTVQSITGVVIRSPANRLANTLSFTVSGCDSISLLASLDVEGICASSGAACSVGSLEPSHVLLAMGIPRDLANSFVRFSLGCGSTAEEVSYVCSILPLVIDRIRSSS